MKRHFADKVVIVTGASSGIGRETARLFAEAGAKVVAASRSIGERDIPVATGRLLRIPTDVTKDDDVRHLIDRTLAAHGRIDILVNNAGIGLCARVADTRLEDARHVMEVNFFGLLRCTQAVLPQMLKQRSGQIVNIGSILSLLTPPGNSIYSASKFAVRAFSDALRLELAPHGLDVILIMPGYTDTPFFDHMIRCGGPPRGTTMKGQSPEKVARAILRACAGRRRELVLTLPAKLGAWTKRLAPRLLDWSLARSRHNP